MKKALGIVSLAALMTVGAAQSNMAQTNTNNVTLDLDFNLLTVAQGTMSTNTNGIIVDGVAFGRINERSIIAELGTATSNTFTAFAELKLVTPVGAPNNWTVLVKDGSNSVDVTGFFGHVPGTNTVGSTFLNPTSGDAGNTEYSIDGFSLHDAAGFPALSTHFSVSGFTVTTSRGIVAGTNGVVGETASNVANVSGLGDKNGNLLVINGSVGAQGNNLGGAVWPAAFGWSAFGSRD